MASKPATCPNGHKYDSDIYGNNCPFCPQGNETRSTGDIGGHTRPIGGGTSPTEPINNNSDSPKTKVFGNGVDGRAVGLLFSYDTNPSGEVYKVFEGKTTIGRDITCDIAVPEDENMTSKHLVIQFVNAKGLFRAQELDGSTNGTYVNGNVYVLGDAIDLKSGDVIVMGHTKFLFLAIPEF